MPCAPVRIEWISEREIRKLFNDGRYYDRARNGELRMVVEQDAEAPQRSRQRRGTRSQIVAYWDGPVKICIVHQYWHRHSGTIDGSGRPNPRMIFLDGTIFKLDKSLD